MKIAKKEKQELKVLDMRFGHVLLMLTSEEKLNPGARNAVGHFMLLADRKLRQEEKADKSVDAATYEKYIERDWSAVTVPELLQLLDKAKGKINPYNSKIKTLERLRRAIDEAFI